MWNGRVECHRSDSTLLHCQTPWHQSPTFTKTPRSTNTHCPPKLTGVYLLALAPCSSGIYRQREWVTLPSLVQEACYLKVGNLHNIIWMNSNIKIYFSFLGVTMEIRGGGQKSRASNSPGLAWSLQESESISRCLMEAILVVFRLGTQS